MISPRAVSNYLGVPGSRLPGITADILGVPAKPSAKRGAAAGYSKDDLFYLVIGRALKRALSSRSRVVMALAHIRSIREEGENSRKTLPELFKDTVLLVNGEHSGNCTYLVNERYALDTIQGSPSPFVYLRLKALLDDIDRAFKD